MLTLVFPSLFTSQVTPHFEPLKESVNDNEEIFSGTLEPVNIPLDKLEEEIWIKIFNDWEEKKVRPLSFLGAFRKSGIPREYRLKFWKLQTGIAFNTDPNLKDVYEKLLLEECEYEKIINWDVKRTFPSHEYFREEKGIGQNALHDICRAYSNYDKEVGYCQGMSFIIAVLLLNMNELDAFSAFIEIMFKFKHRNSFIGAFEALQKDFYLFKRLLTTLDMELAKHLSDVGVESHMYLPQWILTLFAAKFPLSFVYNVFDHFLIYGRNFLLKMCIMLMISSKAEIISKSFDAIFKYFRINLPKKFISMEACKQFFESTEKLKIKNETIEDYEIDFESYRMNVKMDTDPLLALKHENKILFERMLRMESENDLLAHQLINLQINNQELKQNNDNQINNLLKDITLYKEDMESYRERIEIQNGIEMNLHKDMEATVNHFKMKIRKQSKIIKEYKQISSNFEERLEKNMEFNLEGIENYRSIIKDCDQCKAKLAITENNFNEIRKSSEFLANQKITEVEKNLIETKLALAEAESAIYDLNLIIQQLKNDGKKMWLKKMESISKK